MGRVLKASMQLPLNTPSSPGMTCVMVNLGIKQVPPLGAAPDMRVHGQKVPLPRNKCLSVVVTVPIMHLSTGAAPEGSADKEDA